MPVKDLIKWISQLGREVPPQIALEALPWLPFGYFQLRRECLWFQSRGNLHRFPGKEGDCHVHFSESVRVPSRPGTEGSGLLLILSGGRQSEHCPTITVAHDPSPVSLVQGMHMNRVGATGFPWVSACLLVRQTRGSTDSYPHRESLFPSFNQDSENKRKQSCRSEWKRIVCESKCYHWVSQ